VPKSDKKAVRSDFRDAVFKRDRYTCRVCGKWWSKEDADPELGRINAHHISDPLEMPAGGYVAENGITVCDGGQTSCRMKCERFHVSGGKEWEPGMHPDVLYKMIGSSFETAWAASEKLEDSDT